MATLAQDPVNAPERVGEFLQSMPPQSELTPSQIQKKAKWLIGTIHSIAVEDEIKPPQEAFYKIPKGSQSLAIDIMSAAIKPGMDRQKHSMPPETAVRIGQMLSYVNEKQLNNRIT